VPGGEHPKAETLEEIIVDSEVLSEQVGSQDTFALSQHISVEEQRANADRAIAEARGGRVHISVAEQRANADRAIAEAAAVREATATPFSAEERRLLFSATKS
jgi:hypothetical protein